MATSVTSAPRSSSLLTPIDLESEKDKKMVSWGDNSIPGTVLIKNTGTFQRAKEKPCFQSYELGSAGICERF
mgnify:CR=1 FL=1